MTLAQVHTRSKSNEIPAIKALLDTLSLKGCIVTINAIGCQTGIAQKILERGGDYTYWRSRITRKPWQPPYGSSRLTYCARIPSIPSAAFAAVEKPLSAFLTTALHYSASPFEGKCNCPEPRSFNLRPREC